MYIIKLCLALIRRRETTHPRMHWCDVTWAHRVFLVFQHHIPSLRWPSQGWSGPNLHPSSIDPWITHLNTKQSEGPFSSLCGGSDGFPLCSPCDATQPINSSKGSYTLSLLAGNLASSTALVAPDASFSSSMWSSQGSQSCNGSCFEASCKTDCVRLQWDSCYIGREM